MRIAAITPYFLEPLEILTRCVQSVKKQTIPCDHFMIGDGTQVSELNEMDIIHISLDSSHKDYGNTPRAIGGMLAIPRDYDAIFFLDADNTIDPDHVEICVETAVCNPKADYIVAKRRFLRPDGSIIPYTQEPIDQLVDTNCYFLLPGSYHLIPMWSRIPNRLSIIGDRIFLAALRFEGMKFAETNHETVNYYCTAKGVYESLGEPPPIDSKCFDFSEMYSWINSLSDEDHKLLSRRLGFILRGKLANGGHYIWAETAD